MTRRWVNNDRILFLGNLTLRSCVLPGNKTLGIDVGEVLLTSIIHD